MVEKALIVAPIILFVVLALYSWNRAKKVDELESRISTYHAEIARLGREIDYLFDQVDAIGKSAHAYTTAIKEAANVQIKSIKDVTSDPSAVDWIDQPLPNSLRSKYCKADD